MKLWPITTENKCFVKMLWHLLGECVKVTVLLVYSICTFFFQFVLFFLIYKSVNARMVFLHFTFSVFVLYIYSAILLSHFVFFFFKFWTVATVPRGTVAIVTTVFFFFWFLLFFFLFDTRLNMVARAKAVGTEGSVMCVALRCTEGAWVAAVWCVICCCEVQGLLMCGA